MMPKTRTGTCEGCGKRRKLTYPADRTQELFYDGTRKLLLNSTEHATRFNLLIHFYGFCSECLPLVHSQKDIQTLRKNREKKQRYKKAFICIGGPLDGQFAITDDFYREGIYGHLGNDYDQFNSSGGGKSSMIWVHRSLVKAPVSGKDR